MSSPTGVRAPALGLCVAVLTLALDQGTKHWLLHGFDIAARQPVRLAPFFDLVLAWNPGISYSLFEARDPAGRLALLAFTLLATALILFWLWRARSRMAGLALGLLAGGAAGNAWDRYAYGAVADFFHFHIGRFSWYVFNVADCAIVVGVILLIYDSFRGPAARPA